jgi:hypothetical protein
MKTRLTKAAPIAVVAGVVAFCCWPYLASPDTGPAGPGSREAQEIAPALLSPKFGPPTERDPFRLPTDVQNQAPASRDVAIATVQKGDPVAPMARAADASDPLQGLSLSATYVHGKRRLAMINGHLYPEGGSFKVASSAGEPFVIARIDPYKVVLQRSGETVELNYDTKGTKASLHSPPKGSSQPAVRQGAAADLQVNGPGALSARSPGATAVEPSKVGRQP